MQQHYSSELLDNPRPAVPADAVADRRVGGAQLGGEEGRSAQAARHRREAPVATIR